MEKIDLNNYEAYFLDYMEGTLSMEEKHDLFQFLEKNPALKEEMEEDFGKVILTPAPVLFENKEQLKIDESQLILSENTVENYIIASIEGQLSDKQQKQLDDYVTANGLEKMVAYYKATILVPDASIVFAEKKRLKVKTGLVISMSLITRVASVAAVGIILISVAMNWNGSSTTVSGVANKSEVFAGMSKSGEIPEHVKVIAPEIVEPSFDYGVDNQNIANNEDVPEEKTPDNIFIEDEPLFALEEDTVRINHPIEDKENKQENIEGDNYDRDDIVVNPDKEKGNPLEIYSEENDVAMSTVKSEQPYKILTDAASNVINKDISFSRDKDLDSKEYVAYSFKLGKFEFERKKGK